MNTTTRFIPELCPGCQARIEAKYSQYRHANQHIMLWPLLGGGLALLILLTAYLFWSTAQDAIELLDGMGLRRKERGIVFFLLLAATVPMILWLGRLWWRFLQRLPRQFPFECPTCHWTGNVKVRDLSDSEEGEGISLRLEADDVPAEPDPYAARRERQVQRNVERERRRIREQEHEQPPNPDFDFRDR